MADCPHQGLDALLCGCNNATPASNQLAPVSELDLSEWLAEDLACLHSAKDADRKTAAEAAGCHTSPLSPADSCHSDHESAPPQHRQQLAGPQQSHLPHLPCRQPSNQQAAASGAATQAPVVTFCGAHSTTWQQQQQQQQQHWQEQLHMAAGTGNSWTLQSLTPVSAVLLPGVPVPHPPTPVSVGRGVPANTCFLPGGNPLGSSHAAGPGHMQAAVLQAPPPPRQQQQQQCNHPLWQQQMQLLPSAPHCLQAWQQQQMQMQVQQQRTLLMMARQSNAAAMMRAHGPGCATARSVAHRASTGSRKRSSQSREQATACHKQPQGPPDATATAAAAAAPSPAPAAVAAAAASELGVSDMVELLGGGGASSEPGRPSKAFRSFNRDAVARRLQQLSDEQLLALAATAVSSKPPGVLLPRQA